VPLSSQTGSEWTLDRQYYLKKLSRHLLLNFLDLVGLLHRNPTASEPKFTQLEQILGNMHSLINDYRPHQARESLILMMETQLERVRKEVKDVKKVGERIETLLAGLGKIDEDAVNEELRTIVDEAEERRERQKELWEVLDEEMIEA
jgi:mediator of RNA polymerase II transcription subunit 7